MMTILVVDDDSVDREMAQRCLAEIDELEVITASTASEALDMMLDERPDVVLTDLRMPGMTGLELVEHLAEEHPLVPVILMTSKGNEQVAVAALQAGAASYVPKDALQQSLADTVEQILTVVEARHARREVLRFLTACETRFELANDLALITPLVAHIEDNLEALGFGSKTQRQQVGICLMEALANAMLHGNLEVETALRRADRDAFDRQVEERLATEPYASRRVRCVARETPRRAEYIVDDDGPGFDAAGLPDPTDRAHLLQVGGRGIMLMRTIMDEVTFDNGGRRVTMVKHAGET